jgi:cell division septation protein DedD
LDSSASRTKKGKAVSQQAQKDKGKKKGTLTKGTAKSLGYGLVVMFLLVWVFILGVLTGRGDINRLFQRLGLYKTNLAARLGLDPDRQVSTALPVPLAAEAPKALTDSENKTAKEAEGATLAVAASTPKASDLVASGTSADTAKKSGPGNLEAKKSKGAIQQKHDHNRSLASKLSFQNSLDTPTRKQSKTVAKKEAAAHTAAIASIPAHSSSETTAGDEKKKAACAYQVKVASYRTPEEAEKAIADLKKKGIKVNLQKAKDKSGDLFVLKTGRYTTKAEAEKVTKKLKEAKLSGQIQELTQ